MKPTICHSTSSPRTFAWKFSGKCGFPFLKHCLCDRQIHIKSRVPTTDCGMSAGLLDQQNKCHRNTGRKEKPHNSAKPGPHTLVVPTHKELVVATASLCHTCIFSVLQWQACATIQHQSKTIKTDGVIHTVPGSLTQYTNIKRTPHVKKYNASVRIARLTL